MKYIKSKIKNAPCVVGLDPELHYIPKFFFPKEKNIDTAINTIFQYNKALIDIIEQTPIKVLKPQSAFYEKYGWKGIKLLDDTVSYAKQKGFLIVEDSKRGDIGNTSEAYAVGHIGTTFFDNEIIHTSKNDMMTVSPFLGLQSIQPFVDVAKQNNKIIFILLRTSNIGSQPFQHATISKNNRIVDSIVDFINDNNYPCQENLGNIGAVVGATISSDEQKMLRSQLPHALFLVPGYGAQGASGKDVKNLFLKGTPGALISSSRGIIAPKSIPDNCSVSQWEKTIHNACIDFVDDVCSNK